MKSALNLLRAAVCWAVAALTAGIVYYDLTLPDNYIITSGSQLSINQYVEIRSEGALPENYSAFEKNYINASTDYSSEAVRTEQLRLFGIFPIKEVKVTEVEEPVVVPCGTPFGIKLQTEGVLVVEIAGFDSGTGFESPARDAGICEGDVIVSISGQPVSTNGDVSGIIEKSGGKTLGVEIIRNDQNRIVFIKPCKAAADGNYRAGMWVRDSSAGIGTVTFYNPASKVFAGLGHPVCDSDTGDILTMSSGEAADVYISGIKKSSDGAPGELIGMFASDKAIGSLILNSSAGVYGIMDKRPSNASAVPVAMRQEVKTGPAEIYATVNGNNPEKYSVEIEKIDLNGDGNDRNLVVRITDKRLIDKAGGIVQGMSGSPILQNGKLVGAVTHVLVRDPTRGYGIFADTMLEYSEKVTDK